MGRFEQFAGRLVTPLLPTVRMASRPVYCDRELGSLLTLTERPAQPLEQDRLEFLEGEPAAFPGHRDISRLEAVWGEFNRHLGGGFSGRYLSHQSIVNS